MYMLLANHTNAEENMIGRENKDGHLYVGAAEVPRCVEWPASVRRPKQNVIVEGHPKKWDSKSIGGDFFNIFFQVIIINRRDEMGKLKVTEMIAGSPFQSKTKQCIEKKRENANGLWRLRREKGVFARTRCEMFVINSKTECVWGRTLHRFLSLCAVLL